MKTKEIAFTLPVCIAVYEFMFFRGKPVKRLLYLIPLLLTMLIIPLTLLNLSAPLGDIIGDVSEVTRDHRGISRWSYLFTQFRVIVTYLRLLVLPINQNLDYDFPLYHSLFDPAVFLSFMFVLLVFGLGVYLHRISGRAETNKKYWLRLTSFGIFWFFLALSVESSVIPLRDMIFEHRLYLPSVGFFMAVTTAIGAGMERWGDRAAYLKKAVLYAMLAVMLALSGAAYARNTVWQDRIRLWGNAIEGSPNKARPHYNLGNAYKAHDRTYEAINEYQTAIKLKPDYADPHNNLGVAYFDQGRIYEAMNEYQTALRLKPDYADAHNNMGNAYLKQGRIQEAINEYQTAIKLKPDYVKAHYNLGVAYEAQKRTDEAMRAYQTAIRLKPDYANAHNNLGNIYAEQGRFAEAINEYRTALRFNPEDFVARKNLEILQSKTPAALN
jgi:tetratricopeptide (TPR) repeat protein